MNGFAQCDDARAETIAIAQKLTYRGRLALAHRLGFDPTKDKELLEAAWRETLAAMRRPD